MNAAVTVAVFLLLPVAVACYHPKENISDNKRVIIGVPVTKAERFSLQKTDSCTILTIKDPWQGAEAVRQVYYLVERGNESSFKSGSSNIIPVPVRKIICMSSTHLAMISALGEEETITGISGTNYIYNPVLRDKAAKGLIGEIGYDAGINSELILKLSPDLIMMYGIGSESAGYVGKITELGIKVMYDADYLETDPLGKAEWIKVFGALYCKEMLADSIYNSIADSYNEIKKLVAAGISKRPVVLLGLPFRDTWFISPGNSYVSNLISDAGGDYLWKETKSSFSMPYSFESVYLRSLKADYWLNTGTVSHKWEISSFDARLEKIPCYISGNIYNNTRRLSEGGGNDYWESGTLKPHIILRDIANILHPGIFDGNELVFYKKIE